MAAGFPCPLRGSGVNGLVKINARFSSASHMASASKASPITRWLAGLAALFLLVTTDAATRRIELPNGDVYEGEVVDGVLTGQGTYVSNRHRYVGEFLNGKMHGEGTFYWPDGRVFEGRFVNDRRQGEGRLSWPDGRVFEGAFVNDRREGRGRLTWSNGNVYTGEFRANQITGGGRLVWDNQDVYEGEFREGERSGWGTQTWQNGNRYVGEWAANRREGIGAYYWKDGTVYRGEFTANRMHGHGVKSVPDGDRYFQRWVDGELVRETLIAEDARCRMTLDGARWMFTSEECVNGKAHGWGTAVRLDGQAYVVGGRFVLGHMVQGEIGWLSVAELP